MDFFFLEIFFSLWREAREGKGVIFCTNSLWEGGKCHNSSIWLTTKARRLRGCGPRSRPESHITCSWECKECKECEGVNPHTPK
jgi:hypothetical protein